MIRSDMLATISPGLPLIKNDLGRFSGIAWYSERVTWQPVGSPYEDSRMIKRYFCSCGACGTQLENSQNLRCPKCGGKLASMSLYDVSENRYRTVFMSSEISGNVLSQYYVELYASPKLAAGKGAKDIESLREFNITVKKMLFYECHKRKYNTFETKKFPTTKRFITGTWRGGTDYSLYWSEEIQKFFGDKLSLLCVSQASKRCLSEGKMEHVFLELESDDLALNCEYPNVFKPELLDTNLFNDLKRIYSMSGKSDIDGYLIMSDVSVEEFLKLKGFPVDIIPLTWNARGFLNFYGRDLESFAKSKLGEIVFSRMKNEEKIDAQCINSMYALSKNLNDEEIEIFIEFLKDVVDQYGINDAVKRFKERTYCLEAYGIMVNSENLRTRNFCTLVNSRQYRPKKIVDISDLMQENPLECLKSIMPQKDT